MRNLKDKPLVQGVIGNAIFQIIWSGASAMISFYTARSAYIQGLAFHWVALIGAAIFFLLSAAWYFIDTRRRKQKIETLEENLKAEYQSKAESIQSQHQTALESTQTQHKSEIESLKANHQRETERLQRQSETQSVQISVREGLLEKHKFLHEMADTQAMDISSYVKVERVYLCYQELTDSLPRIVFGIDIYNKSVFDITIEDAMDGHVEIAGKPLLRDKRIIYKPKNISPSTKESVTIEHRLSQEEAGLIAKCENDALGAFFYFDRLVLMIRGSEQFPQVDRKQLILPKHICSEDEIRTDNWRHYEAKVSELESERDLLKSKFEELNRWKVTFEVSKQSQVHYTYIEALSYFRVNLLIQFENKSNQDLTMYMVDVSLYTQPASGEEKKIDFHACRLNIERHPAMSKVDFSRGLKLIAGELSDWYWFQFTMEFLFTEELSADCFLRVTMSAMNQDPLSKDYSIDDWEAAQHSNSYISERH